MPQDNELPRRRRGASRHQPGPAATAIREEPLLAALRKMWQGKYAIEYSDQACTAQRIGHAEVITTGTLHELREAIRRDAVSWNRELYGSST